MARAITWVEPHPERELLAIGAEDGDVLLTAPAPDAPLLRLAHEGFVVNVRWSPDGSTLIVAEMSGRLSLYDPDGKQRRVLDTGHGTLWASAFDRSGARFATVGATGKAIVWNSDDWRERYRIGAANGPEVRAVAFVGDKLIIGFSDGYFEAFPDGGGKCLAGAQLFPRGVSSIAGHPREERALLGGALGSIRLIDTEAWSLVDQWRDTPPRPIAVNQLAFDGDGSHFVAACSDGSARRFRSKGDSLGDMLDTPFYLRTPKPEWSRTMIVASAAFDPRRPVIYTARFDGHVDAWDTSNDLIARRLWQRQLDRQ
jgi:WD40 repeat protein